MTIKCAKCGNDNPGETSFCGRCGAKLVPGADETVSSTSTLETPVKTLSVGGTFAGRYQIIEDLGKGGMGRVYKAIDNEIGETVALKLLKPEIASDEQTIERFRQEIKTARQISHKNVCRMYHLGRDQTSYYITMEYVSGEDLKSTISRVGQLSVAKTIAIVRQLCDGLAEAHRLGVVHRDLKPQNIMIDKYGNAKIMDFGIARSLKSKGITEAGVLIGTPEYMSPEQVDGQDVDPRADIYALGIVLYEMLTGRVPFEGETPFSIAYKHKSQDPPDPRGANPLIKEDLAQLVLKCMEKDRARRYQSAGDVSADLAKIEQGIPTTERIISGKKTTTKQITVTFGLKKVLIPAAAVILFVLAAFGIWRLIPHRAQEKRSIAVISFKNQTGDKSYDYLQEAIPNLLITSLEQSKYLSVMTWERIHDILAQMGQPEVTVITDDLGFDACVKDGVGAIVLGSFIKAGDMFATDVKVLDVRTKKLLKSASSRGEGVRSILEKQIGDLSKEIAKGVGLPERQIEPAQGRIADLTTSSMEAYQNYLRGVDQLERFYHADAKKSLEKAVELDPDFAIAYLQLGRLYNTLTSFTDSQEAYQKAKALSGRTTEKERLYIEEAYAGAVERNREKRLRILTELIAKYPKEKFARFELGLYYYGGRELEAGAAALKKAIDLDPDYGYAINQLAYVYADMGDYPNAFACFEKYRTLSPNDANPVDSMAEIYFRMGDLDRAVAKYKEVLGIKPDFFPSMGGLAYIYALKEDYDESLVWVDRFAAAAPTLAMKGQGVWMRLFLQYWRGEYSVSLAGLQDLIGIARASGLKEGIAPSEAMAAFVHLARGESEPGRRAIGSWLSLALEANPQDSTEVDLLEAFTQGLFDLSEKKPDAARSRLAVFDAKLPKVVPQNRNFDDYLYLLLRGEILLQEGALDEALALLEKAPGRGKPPSMSGIMNFYTLPFPVDTLARVYAARGEIDKAIAEYEKLVNFDPKREERTLIHPKYHYRLAKLYEKKGLKEKAAAEFRKFLKIWKNADAALPELADAKKSLAALG